MKQSSRATVGAMGLTIVVLAAAMPAQGPAKKAEPWQRKLGFFDSLKAAHQENQIAQLTEAGKFTEALKIAESLEALRSKVQGADHWETVKTRVAAEAIRRVLKAKKDEQQNYRRTFSLQRQAEALMGKEQNREALALLEQALAIRRKVLGEEHPDIAFSYNNVAYVLDALGQHKEAEREHRKALALLRKTLGEEHPGTAKSYDNLAANLNDQGRHREAEEGFRKALAIRRKVLGEQNTDTAVSYNNVATNLVEQGKYRDAEENYRKSLALLRKLLGEEAPDTVTAYSNLANNLGAQGKYKEEEEGFRKVLAIRRKVLGEIHSETALSYNNLAANLDDQGRHREAEIGHRTALAIRRKVLGEEHADTAQSYGNLANSLQAQGNLKEAEQNHVKALAIRRKVLDEEHLDTALSYGNLAYNQYLQGKHRQAEEGFEKALAIRSKVLGEDHPSTASSYGNLAGNLTAQGKHRQAEEGFRKELAIRRKMLGEDHPDTAKSYNNVGHILCARGNYKEAEKLFCRAAVSLDKTRLYVGAAGLERAAFNSEHSQLPALAAVLVRNGKLDDAWQRFEESLARGTLDDFTARLRRPQAEREKQTQITARIDRLSKLIEGASIAKPTPEQSKQRDEWLTQLRRAYDELAAFTQQLEQKYGPIAGQVFPRPQIQKSLPPDAALIAWLDLAGQPKAVDPNGEHWAILLRAIGDPIWLRLHGSGEKGSWTDADTKLPSKLRTALQTPGSEWQTIADLLRKQRMKPLAQHLKGVRRLIVLPSTALAGIPVEVIADGYTISYAHSATMYAHLRRQPKPNGKGLLVLADPIFRAPPLVEKMPPLPPRGVLLTMVAPGSNAFRAGLRTNDVLLRYGDTDLNSPMDLKPQSESNDPEKRIPVIVWRNGEVRKRPIYVLPGKLGVAIHKEPAPRAMAEQRRLDLWVSRRGDGDWKELPGTRIEAAALQHLFGASARLLQKSQASEQRLNELAASGELGKYRYLHLATHGEVDNIFPLRSAVILSRDRLPDEKQKTELLVSGQPIPDGRLEAGEALRRWNLQADLVTLSACQTALGKYERGEGFVGFAQALVLCGSRSVCLSLWEVKDVSTALLMGRFYQNLLGKREGLKAPMSKAAALDEAKRWLRTLPRAEVAKVAAALTGGESRGHTELPAAAAGEKPGDCPFAHPHYWAAFILTGHAD